MDKYRSSGVQSGSSIWHVHHRANAHEHTTALFSFKMVQLHPVYVFLSVFSQSDAAET